MIIFKRQRDVKLTAGFAPPSSEKNAFSSTGSDIAGKGSTHAVLTLLTVTCVKHTGLGTEDDIWSSECHVKARALCSLRVVCSLEVKVSVIHMYK